LSKDRLYNSKFFLFIFRGNIISLNSLAKSLVVFICDTLEGLIVLNILEFQVLFK